jgi:hypothetical protein
MHRHEFPPGQHAELFHDELPISRVSWLRLARLELLRRSQFFKIIANGIASKQLRVTVQ